MKHVPIPIYKGDPDVVQVDPLSKALHDGIAAGRTAVARDLLKQEIKQVEKTLRHSHTASGARNSAADQALIQHVHDALSKLGATCRLGSAADGNVNPAVDD
jgi:hypothetical protein